MDYRATILALADEYCAVTGRSHARVSTLIHNQGAWLKSVRERNAGFTVDTYDKAIRWFSNNWPEGAIWPEGVERPPRVIPPVVRRGASAAA